MTGYRGRSRNFKRWVGGGGGRVCYCKNVCVLSGYVNLNYSDCVSYECFMLCPQLGSFSLRKQVWTFSVLDKNSLG